MTLTTSPTPYGFFDKDAAAARGKALHDQYVSAQPFPYIVLDEFLDEDTINLCLRDFPTGPGSRAATYARRQESGKAEYKPESLSAPLRSLFYSFNSLPFITFLEELSGIKGLSPDPYFLGGGLHELVNGGYLNVHTDFNYHALLNLERRLNVLVYLNKDWKEEYGGCLDLWDDSMKVRRARILPTFNRCVIFNTSASSFHGNPEPIRHPAGISRKSLALYYYTATWDGLHRSSTTHFAVRPASADSFDYQVRVGELLDDYIPPILLRAARRLLRRLRPARGTISQRPAV